MIRPVAELTFPRQKAITRGFRLGAPRSFVVTDERLVFTRSSSGTDPVNSLWVLEKGAEEPRLVVDATALMLGEEDLPPAERARRERLREASGGITTYTTDRDATRAAFVLSGVVYIVELIGEPRLRALESPGLAIDPRLNRDGTHVAYVADGAVHVVELATENTRTLVQPESETVTYGLADFISAEELDRVRGLYWLDDAHLLVQRTDEAPVQVWFTSNPADPASEPVQQRYPVAGTPNAEVSLWLLGLDGERMEVAWDHHKFEYLATVNIAHGVATIGVLNRSQNEFAVFTLDALGQSTPVANLTDPSWIDLHPGVPARTREGVLVTIEVDDESDTNRLCLDRVPITPPGLQVFAVADITDHGILILASTDPTEQHAYRVHRNGAIEDISDEHPITSVRGSDHTLLKVSAAPQVTWDGQLIESFAHTPVVNAEPTFHDVDGLRISVLLPQRHDGSPLPIVLAPYGGPHHQRVIRAEHAFLSDQWLANQGYLVVVADGHGTGGRGPAWDRSIRGDLATIVLDDQVRALQAVKRLYPQLADTSRVGIHGWSFGGYLAALAVLDRPDVFHVAVAGAPVTDWKLYDTGYTERYLGTPAEHPDWYANTSLIPRAPQLTRPLMLIHGLADDNVVVANTLQLSSALLAAGKAHTVLPLTGVTHMTPQEEVAENLLLLQVEFLNQALKP